MKRAKRRGMVLLLVLVVVAMLALVCLGYSELMMGERRAALTASRQSQVRVLAQSGAELVRQFLDRAPTDQLNGGGLYDNPQRFGGVLIADDDTPQNRGRCSIVAPRLDGDHTIVGARYGLQDESTRINLAAILKLGQQGGGQQGGGQQGGGQQGGGQQGGGQQGGGQQGGGQQGGGQQGGGQQGGGQQGGGNTLPPVNGATTSPTTVPAKTMLMGLPGMTDEISDAILDWIDTDDTPRANGAESDFYGGLTPAYAPRNAPPVTIEELLLVRGVTPELLFGIDAAQMGLVPASAVADGNIEGVDNSDGSMNHGWAAYLTLWSAEVVAPKADGTAKIDLNGSDLQKLHDDLVAAGIDEDSATFIAVFRAHGAFTGTIPQNGTTPTAGVSLPETIKAAGTKLTSLKSVLDLVGVTVEIPPALQNPKPPPPPAPQLPKYLKSPYTSDSGTLATSLPKLLDNATVQAGSKSIPGRININQASRIVLMCIPSMTSDLADQIVAARQMDPTTAPADQKYDVWPLIEGIVPLATMKTMQPYVTAGGNVFRAQVIGSFDKGGPVGRIEAVFDSTQSPTKLLFWKDVSRLPGGFPVEPVGQVTPTTNQATTNQATTN